jgi:CubicO group peptidase (beta-lactamase class C family)
MRVIAIILLSLFAENAQAQPKSKPLPVSGEEQPKLAVIDKLMVEYLREQKAPGAALAIAKDGRLVYARGFGYADLDRKVAVQPTSLFRLASASKPFTVAAIASLSSEAS